MSPESVEALRMESDEYRALSARYSEYSSNCPLLAEQYALLAKLCGQRAANGVTA